MKKNKLTLKQKIVIGAAVGLAGLVGLLTADRVTGKPIYVQKVESEVKIKGIPSPFTSWDMFYVHELTFKDGSQIHKKTRDFDFPLVRKVTGYKPRHPQPGDEFVRGGIIGGTYDK